MKTVMKSFFFHTADFCSEFTNTNFLSIEKLLVVVRNRVVSHKVFEVPSYVLFALFAAWTHIKTGFAYI